MASLQYNFFPTDFFYRRPAQSTPVVDSTPSAALTTQTQKRDEVVDDDIRQPVSVVYHGNKTSVSMRRQGEKLGRIYMQNRGEQVKLPRNSLSCLILTSEEFTDSS
ncbi:hypothetical protein CRYUN_Cryun08bG0089300 [Craigia yunnanensis]